MLLKNTRPVAFVIYLFTVVHVNGDVNQITKLCRHEGCNDLKQDHLAYSGKEYSTKLVKLLTGGIGQLLWEDARNISSRLVHANRLSIECHNQLLRVSKSLDDGRNWAFRCKYDNVNKSPVTVLPFPWCQLSIHLAKYRRPFSMAR